MSQSLIFRNVGMDYGAIIFSNVRMEPMLDEF